MLVSQGLKTLETQLPLKRQEGTKARGNEMMMTTTCGDLVTGKVSEFGCSFDTAKLDADMDFSRLISLGAEVTHNVGFRDFGFAGDLVKNSEMAGSELVVQNSLFPFSDLGNGLEAEFGEGVVLVEEEDLVGEY